MKTACDNHSLEPARTEDPKGVPLLDGGEAAGRVDLTNLVKLLARQAAREMFSAAIEATSK
jgi:hypothetical protein